MLVTTKEVGGDIPSIPATPALLLLLPWCNSFPAAVVFAFVAISVASLACFVGRPFTFAEFVPCFGC